nr:hypothetical protein [Tanacetum cinerariifolium]
MPYYELRSVLEFKNVDSDDFHDNDVSTSDHIFQDDYAFAERLSLPDHMDHICEEVSSLHSRLVDHMDHICEEVSSLHSRLVGLESSIAQKVSNEIQSYLPTLVTNALQEELPGILLATLKDCLILIVKESLQTCIPAVFEQFAETQTQLNINVVKQMNKQFNISCVAQKSAMVLYQYEKKDLVDLTIKQDSEDDDDDLDKQPLFKRFKIMHPILSKPQLSVKQFTDQLFGTSSKFSPTRLRELTPPRDESKRKGIPAKEPPKDIIPFMEERGSAQKMPKIKSFITLKGNLSQKEFYNQIKEMKRLAELKEQEKKSEEELKKLLNLTTFKAQALKCKDHEEKKAKMLKEFNKCISERTDPSRSAMLSTLARLQQ